MTRPARVACCGDVDVFVDAFDFAKDWIERVFQRPVNRIALRRPQFIEIRVDAFACFEFRLPMAAAQVPRHIISGEDGLGDVVEHHGSDYQGNGSLAARPHLPISRHTASVNSVVDADPPRSRVRTSPAASTRSSAPRMRGPRRARRCVQHHHATAAAR